MQELCLDDGHGEDDLLNLIIEMTGQRRKDTEARVATACDMWVPAINDHGGFGRRAFLEIHDPWNAQSEVRAALQGVNTAQETSS